MPDRVGQSDRSDHVRPSWRLERLKHDVDEHVQIVLDCDGRPAVGFSIGNWHGRRGVHISIDGMGVASLLLDLKELSPAGDRIAKFCPYYCGEELALVSSKAHSCDGDERPGPMMLEIRRLNEQIKELEAIKQRWFGDA